MHVFIRNKCKYENLCLDLFVGKRNITLPQRINKIQQAKNTITIEL